MWGWTLVYKFLTQKSCLLYYKHRQKLNLELLASLKMSEMSFTCMPFLMKHAGVMRLHAVHPGPCMCASGTQVLRSPVYCTTHLHARSGEDPFENQLLDGCRKWGSHFRVAAGHYTFIRVLEKAQGKQLHLFYCLRHFLQLLPFLGVTNPSADPARPYLSCKSWQDHSLKQYSHRLNTGYQNVCLVFSRNTAVKIYNTGC